MTVSITKSGTGKIYLVFQETAFDEDGEGTIKTGTVLQESAEKAQANLKKYQSGEKKRVFGQRNRNTGLYDMVLASEEIAEEGEVAPEGELAHE